MAYEDLLLEKREDVHFCMVGKNVTWDNVVIRDQIPTSWRDHFHLLGERGDVRKILPGLDIACLSSSSEGFPNVVVEAMACGIPCVVTDVGDSAFIVGDTGRVVPARDPESMAAALLGLVDADRDERQNLGRTARERVAERFELLDVVRQYEALYASLGGRKA